MQREARLVRAVQTATRKLSSAGKFDDLLHDVLAICVEAVGASGGTIYVHDPVQKRLRFQHVLPEEVADKLPFKDMPDDQGIAGQVFQTRQTQISKFNRGDAGSGSETRQQVAEATGVSTQTMITVPLMIEDFDAIGVVQLLNKQGGDFDETDVAVLDTISAVCTMAYLNAKLNEESSRASTLLGMGKVSHDIGNLAATLHATLGVGDLAMPMLRDQIHNGAKLDECEAVIHTVEETFEELKHSVDRIVGYSRLISDLSAGRALRPNKTEGKLSETIEHSAAYMEPEARKNHVEIEYDIQSGCESYVFDELYLFRIVQNLVGNAIKAVAETAKVDLKSLDEDERIGRVTVRYAMRDGQHVLEVADTGPGMRPEVAERILAGTARSQWDKGTGSGWGMRIVLELAGTHDAKVEIDSELGAGSIFRIVFPK